MTWSSQTAGASAWPSRFCHTAWKSAGAPLLRLHLLFQKPGSPARFLGFAWGHYGCAWVWPSFRSRFSQPCRATTLCSSSWSCSSCSSCSQMRYFKMFGSAGVNKIDFADRSFDAKLNLWFAITTFCTPWLSYSSFILSLMILERSIHKSILFCSFSFRQSMDFRYDFSIALFCNFTFEIDLVSILLIF